MIKVEIDARHGLMHILSAIMQGIEDSLSKERARDIAYNAGYRHGEEIGRSLGRASPEEAIKKVQEHIGFLQELKIMDLHKKEDSVEMAVQFRKCVVLDTIIENKLSYPSLACKFMWGFWEGILETITSLRGKKLVYLSSISNMCIGTISLRGNIGESLEQSENTESREKGYKGPRRETVRIEKE